MSHKEEICDPAEALRNIYQEGIKPEEYEQATHIVDMMRMFKGHLMRNGISTDRKEASLYLAKMHKRKEHAN